MPFPTFDSNPVVSGLFLYISLWPTNAAFQKLVQMKEPRCPFQFSLFVACFHCLLEPLSSEAMCSECFVVPGPSGLALPVFDWLEFFPFGVCRTGHAALENIENIAIDQNQQIIMNLASFQKLDFRRQAS